MIKKIQNSNNLPSIKQAGNVQNGALAQNENQAEDLKINFKQQGTIKKLACVTQQENMEILEATQLVMEEFQDDKNLIASLSKGIPTDVAFALDNKIGEGFSSKVCEIAQELNCNPNDLLDKMYSESGINPKSYNPKGAAGLAQFTQIAINQLYISSNKLMTALASKLGKEKLNVSDIIKLDFNDQLDMYKEMMRIAKVDFAKMDESSYIDRGTLYAMNLSPARAQNDIIATKGEKLYNNNKGVDLNKDGYISKNDMSQRLDIKHNEMLNWLEIY